jgi:hypothetical protein
MGSIAGGRRTQSALPAFVASTHPSTMTMSVYGGSGSSSAYSPALTEAISHIPQVKHVESWVGAGVAPLQRDGSPNLDASINPMGSVDGLFFDEDRATAVQGRMADPAREDEFVTTALGAQLLGAQIGQVIPVGLYGADQFGQQGFGTPSVAPLRRIDMTLVGIVELNNQIIEDDVDRRPTAVLYTPALTRAMLATGATQGTWYAMQLVHGDSDVAAVERALLGAIPQGEIPNFRIASITNAKVERAVRPESIALGVFGVIAALAALAIGAQAVARQVRSTDPDLEVLRAFGASPTTTWAAGAVGALGAIVIGTALAGAIAVGLSPLAPLGPVRRVYPSPGLAADWTVLSIGALVLTGGLGAVAAVVAIRFLRRQSGDAVRASARGSRVATVAAGAGVPAPAVTGLRFALERTRGRTAAPVRSALVGSVIAVALVTATLTFAAGLRTLVNTPSLYGWNWDVGLSSIFGVPPPALHLLDTDPAVDGYAGYQDSHAQLDGRDVPVLLGDPRAKVTPPILSGHQVEADDQIVLGTATLASLHKQVGDTVVGSFGTPTDPTFYVAPTALTIVGTATLPAVVGSGSFADHTTMGSGAILSNVFLGAPNPSADPTTSGPPLVFVRLRSGVSPAKGIADMHRIAEASDRAFASDPTATGAQVDVLPVQHPAEIVNYASTGATPVVLAVFLAVGAVAALGLTLQSSVRHRRRDLGLLKTLGFTRRQLSVAVACQASVSALVGLAAGLPTGIAAGRWLWILFARDIHAVPQPTVPASLTLVVLGALAVALLVAAGPARGAARVPAGLALHAE